MEHTYHREEAELGPMVLERISDFDKAVELLGDFTDIRGMVVVNPTGDEVGRVDNLYMDPKQRKIVMAGITFGGVWGFGAKHVLVPMNQLEIIGDTVRVMTTPEIVKNAPAFETLEGGDVSPPTATTGNKPPKAPKEHHAVAAERHSPLRGVPSSGFRVPGWRASCRERSLCVPQVFRM